MASAAQKRHICHLYKRSLNLARNYFEPFAWFRAAYVIRHHFRENMNESDPRRIDQLVRGAEDVLDVVFHPEPYVAPHSRGGAVYQRNTPPPIEFCLNGWCQFDLEETEEHRPPDEGL